MSWLRGADQLTELPEAASLLCPFRLCSHRRPCPERGWPRLSTGARSLSLSFWGTGSLAGSVPWPLLASVGRLGSRLLMLGGILELSRLSGACTSWNLRSRIQKAGCSRGGFELVLGVSEPGVQLLLSSALTPLPPWELAPRRPVCITSAVSPRCRESEHMDGNTRGPHRPRAPLSPPRRAHR